MLVENTNNSQSGGLGGSCYWPNKCLLCPREGAGQSFGWLGTDSAAVTQTCPQTVLLPHKPMQKGKKGKRGKKDSRKHHFLNSKAEIHPSRVSWVVLVWFFQGLLLFLFQCSLRLGQSEGICCSVVKPHELFKREIFSRRVAGAKTCQFHNMVSLGLISVQFLCCKARKRDFS